MNVFTEMFLQVVSDFHLGDFRELTYDEVEFFYEASRPGLLKATKPNG